MLPRRGVNKLQQLDLLGEVEVKPPEPATTVRVGRRSIQIPLARKRREARDKLKEVLTSLEGRDILVSFCGGSRSHWWFDNLRLNRLKAVYVGETIVVLSGQKAQSVRLFLDQLVNVREQSYDNNVYYLIDFWNGLGEYPIDAYKPAGYNSLRIQAANCIK